jgi:hypothetical protein
MDFDQVLIFDVGWLFFYRLGIGACGGQRDRFRARYSAVPSHG